MVLVQRKIKIVFIIQSNRTITQIRNYVTTNVFPQWSTALTNAFAGYALGAPTIPVQDVYIRTRSDLGATHWEVYPKFFIQAEVTTATQDDVRARYATFIEDAKTRTRNLLAGLTGTTVVQIYKDPVDGTGTVVSTT